VWQKGEQIKKGRAALPLSAEILVLQDQAQIIAQERRRSVSRF
jgi:hypothetical protein